MSTPSSRTIILLKQQLAAERELFDELFARLTPIQRALLHATSADDARISLRIASCRIGGGL